MRPRPSSTAEGDSDSDSSDDASRASTTTSGTVGAIDWRRTAKALLRYLGHALAATAALLTGFLVGAYLMHVLLPGTPSPPTTPPQHKTNATTTPLETLAADLQVLHSNALRAFSIDPGAAPRASAADVDACQAAVEKAYHRLSRAWHPDKCKYARVGLMHAAVCSELYLVVKTKRRLAMENCLMPGDAVARARRRVLGIDGADDDGDGVVYL